jgi:hypothetical protein
MMLSDEIHELNTLGAGRKKRLFLYRGSVKTGVVLLQSGKPRIDAGFFMEALCHFSGKQVVGGFREDAAPPGSFGEWVDRSSSLLNSRKLTPRHGSFMAAILCAECGVQPSVKGKKIVLEFPRMERRA